jgi:acyl-CoA oxidase
MTIERARFPKLEPNGPQGHELLAAERQGASFDPQELSLYMHGREYLDARESILKILEKDTVLGDKSQRYYQARPKRFYNSMRHARRFAELIQ